MNAKSHRNLERAKSPSLRERNEAILYQFEGLEKRMNNACERFSDSNDGVPQRRVRRPGTTPKKMRLDELADDVSVVSDKLDDLARKIDEQKRVEDRIDRLMREMEKMSMLMEEKVGGDSVAGGEDMEDGSAVVPVIDPGPIGTVLFEHDHVQWNMTGYKSYEPHHDVNYFLGLSWQAEGMECRQVISGIIPCFNEGGDELHRTVQGLRTQYMHAGWRLETVIVMDGVDHMDPTMANYLESMFGVAVNSKDPKTDPFLLIPEAETIVIHAADRASCQRRIRVCSTSSGGYSLVLKRSNRRKANSQMWWLGAHAVSTKCLYALATDCGTVFDRTTTSRLIQRLSDESDLHACTGFQRTMSSRMQGDTSWEFFLRPMDFVLCMLQRFEFEVDHVSFKSVDDALGTMHVIPGPCGLYRYRSLGSLKDGLMQRYFQIFRRKSSSLTIGNVELVEDRIPGALLAFPLKPSKREATMPSTGWSRTGYCHDALFYLEAEKPLSQLVKQRRRWLNGTYATYFWLLSERIISNSNQASTTRFVSWIMVMLHIIQGMTVRYSGPALLIVWMWRFGLFLPDILSDPANIFDPSIAVADLEEEPLRLWGSILLGGGYALLYVWFVLAHKPRAVPVVEDSTIVRYTEATKWRSDKSSSYHPFVMWLSVVVNVVVVFLFIANAGGIIYTQGWGETPVIVKILLCICLIPFGLGFLDGLTRLDFRCFFNLLLSALPSLPMMVWFTVWLPAYATTRASDLTWGNRGGTNSIDVSEKSLERAQRGSKLAWSLILTNLAISAFVIWRMQNHGLAFPLFVLIYTLILSVPFVFSFIEIALRLFTCCAGDSWTTHPEINKVAQENSQEMMFGDMSDFNIMCGDREQVEQKPFNKISKRKAGNGSVGGDEATVPDVLSDKEGNDSLDGNSSGSNDSGGNISNNSKHNSYSPPGSVNVPIESIEDGSKGSRGNRSNNSSDTPPTTVNVPIEDGSSKGSRGNGSNNSLYTPPATVEVPNKASF